MDNIPADCGGVENFYSSCTYLLYYCLNILLLKCMVNMVSQAAVLTFLAKFLLITHLKNFRTL